MVVFREINTGNKVNVFFFDFFFFFKENEGNRALVNKVMLAVLRPRTAIYFNDGRNINIFLLANWMNNCRNSFLAKLYLKSNFILKNCFFIFLLIINSNDKWLDQVI